MSKSSDNSNIASKLDLRRTALRETGWKEYEVLDLCAGAGHIWTALRRELPVRRYLACDRKPRLEGTIRGEAAQLAGSLDLAPFNVIDIDPYGEPWEPLLLCAERITRETVFFLTHGRIGIAVTPSKVIRRAARRRLPPCRRLDPAPPAHSFRAGFRHRFASRVGLLWPWNRPVSLGIPTL